MFVPQFFVLASPNEAALHLGKSVNCFTCCMCHCLASRKLDSHKNTQ